MGSVDCCDFAFGDVEPAAVAWRMMAFEPIRQTAGFFGSKGLVERGVVMGVEVVFDEDDFLCLGKDRVGKQFEHMGVVDPGAGGVFGDKDFPPAFQRGVDHEGCRRSFADVFAIVFRGLTGLGGMRRAYLP